MSFLFKIGNNKREVGLKKVAIAIPTHKNSLSRNEKISLLQVRKILKNYDTYFIIPQGLVFDYGMKGIQNIEFNQDEFKSFKSYNKFMLKPDLYLKFKEYDYLLIYQLDAFVFEDKLEEFCNEGYDYIGGPTLQGMFKFYRNEQVLFTQNGGFSLRKINSFLSWIEKNKQDIDLMNYFDSEDSIIYALRNSGLVHAPIKRALAFSFDSNVKECFRLNDNQLPFGCHAWERYAYEIWKPFIEGFGYSTESPDPQKLIIHNYYKLADYNYKWLNRYNPSLLKEILYEKISSFHNRVYVFGMGWYGYNAMQLLMGAGVEIEAYIDNNPDTVARGMYPLKAMTGNRFLKKKVGIPVIVAIEDHVNVCVSLENIGYKHNQNYATYAEIFCSLEKRVMY